MTDDIMEFHGEAKSGERRITCVLLPSGEGLMVTLSIDTEAIGLYADYVLSMDQARELAEWILSCVEEVECWMKEEEE